MLQKDVRYLFAHLSPLIFVHLPLFFIRRPRLCLDMVSSGGLSRLPRSRHLGTFGTLLGPLPKRPLYLSSDAPQIFTELSSLPLASDFASGLNVTVLTSLKSFKSVSMHKKNCFEKALGMLVRNLPWVPGEVRHTLTRVGVPELDRLVFASTGDCTVETPCNREHPACAMRRVSTSNHSGNGKTTK